MTEVVKSREPATRTRWRLGGALTVLAVATAIGVGGHPAFAAPKPAPGSGSTAGSAATSAGHHQARTAKQKATSTSSSGTGSASSATGTATATEKPATPNTSTGATATTTPQAITPNDIHPEVVAAVTVVPGIRAATVTWGAAAVVVGATHYVASVATTVGSSPAGTTCDVPSASTHTCTITGLAAGVSYTATVTSYNTAGTGTPVETGVSTAFTVVADAPVITSVTSGVGGGTLVVTWTESGGITDLANYTATASPGGASCTSVTNATPGTCTIGTALAPLPPGAAYTVTVVANATLPAGNSAPSAPSTPVVPGPPLAPTGVVAYMGNGQAMVTWIPPTGSGSPSVTYYTVTSSPGGKVCHSALLGGTPDNFCTVTGLVSTTSYTFTVVSHSAILGDSAASAPSPTAIPMSLALLAGANSKYVTAENAGSKALVANRAGAGLWETFDVVDQGDGYVALRSRVNTMYVSAEAAGNSWLIANRLEAGLWEEFSFVNNSDGSVSLRARVNGRYVTAENGGASPLIANRWGIGAWEKFSWVNLSS